MQHTTRQQHPLQEIPLTDCAHCGGKAGVKDHGRRTTGHGESTREISLGCHNKGCEVHVMAGGRDEMELWKDVLAAVEAWNTRAA